MSGDFTSLEQFDAATYARLSKKQRRAVSAKVEAQLRRHEIALQQTYEAIKVIESGGSVVAPPLNDLIEFYPRVSTPVHYTIHDANGLNGDKMEQWLRSQMYGVDLDELKSWMDTTDFDAQALRYRAMIRMYGPTFRYYWDQKYRPGKQYTLQDYALFDEQAEWFKEYKKN
jgi:hypothetical protein